MQVAIEQSERIICGQINSGFGKKTHFIGKEYFAPCSYIEYCIKLFLQMSNIFMLIFLLDLSEMRKKMSFCWSLYIEEFEQKHCKPSVNNIWNILKFRSTTIFLQDNSILQ